MAFGQYEKGQVAVLASLAETARPRNEDDHGSNRQLEAENAFFGALMHLHPDVFGEDSDFALWGLKATTEETIDEAMVRFTACVKAGVPLGV